METLEKTYRIPSGTKPGSIGLIKPLCGCEQIIKLILSSATKNVLCITCGRIISVQIQLEPQGGRAEFHLLPPGTEPPEPAATPAKLDPGPTPKSAHASPSKEDSNGSQENPLMRLSPPDGFYSDREFREDMGHLDSPESSDR